MPRFAAAVLLALFIVPSSLAAQASIEQLEREAAVLRAEVDRLKAMDRAAAGEGEAIRMRLKHDVFNWVTDDGAFAFHWKTVAQARFTYHDVRGNSGRGGDNGGDFSNFRIPHMRFTMEGNFFAPEFLYKAQWRPMNDGAGVRIDDLWFCWAPTMLFNLTAGQMRVPATYETLIDPENYSLMDRSAADQAFDQDWGKGILLTSALDLWGTRVLAINLGLFNGAVTGANAQGAGFLDVGSGNSDGVRVTDADRTDNFTGGFRNRDGATTSQTFGQRVDNDLMPAFRIEFQPMGNMARHNADTRTTRNIEEWQLMIACAVNWFSARIQAQGTGGGTFLGNTSRPREIGTDGTPLGPTGSGRSRYGMDALNATLDGHFRWMGFGVNWSIHWRRVSFHNFGAMEGSNTIDPYIPAAVEDSAYSVEINYYALPRQLLFAFRISAVNFDEFGSLTGGGQRVDGDSFGSDATEYNGGLCYEFHGDNMKLSFDYRYVVQQMPHGVAKGNKLSFDAIERISEYRAISEIRFQFQWIF
ncbi:MAG: hypothetical protein IT462_06655 [Planctomycetes bacterium]|nr:hypothetical protein [Planctomycetota bacterium]